MSDYKLVPVVPTPEMVDAAEDAYMPFGDMELAIRMALLAAPAVQGELVGAMNLAYELGGLEDGSYHLEVDELERVIHAARQAAQGEPVGEVRFELGAPSVIYAELYSKRLPALAPGTKLYAAPQPAEQQPAPDVARLVEALDLLKEAHDELVTIKAAIGFRVNTLALIERIDSALAAHRKQGGEA